MGAIKATLLGGILTFVVAIVIGSQGSRGGFLAIHNMPVGDYSVFWSWPMFLASSGLCWALILLQPD
ncbi:MAG: hypothetical protein AAGL68_08435 [Pseudomonadota bacterium]